MKHSQLVPICQVLQLRDGEELKVGIVNGAYDDHCTVKWRWPVSLTERQVVSVRKVFLCPVKGKWYTGTPLKFKIDTKKGNFFKELPFPRPIILDIHVQFLGCNLF